MRLFKAYIILDVPDTLKYSIMYRDTDKLVNMIQLKQWLVVSALMKLQYQSSMGPCELTIIVAIVRNWQMCLRVNSQSKLESCM